MATAAIVGGLVVGGIASGVGASKQADAQVDAAEIAATAGAEALVSSQEANLAAQQQQQAFIQQGRADATGTLTQAGDVAAGQLQAGFGQGRTDLQAGLGQFQQTLDPFAQTAQTAQQAQLGLLGLGGNVDAANQLMNSPLVQAINQENQQAVNARAAASGVSGGNVLTALQDANTSTILQAGLGGLQSLSAQSNPFVGQLAQGQLGTAGNLANLAVNQGQSLAGITSGIGSGIANIQTGAASQLCGGALQAGLTSSQNILNAGNLLGQTQAQGVIGQGNVNAIPSLSNANLLGQATQLGTFAASGGFSGGAAPAGTAPNPFGSPFANGVVL